MKTPYLVALIFAVTLGATGSLALVTPAQANGCITPAAGTQLDPFLIQTPANLTCLKDNGSYYWGGGKYFRQTANLDMTGQNWSSGIGNYTTQFTGHFDGAGYSINNLSIAATHSGNEYWEGLALFGYLATGSTLDNLNLANVSVSVTGSGNSRVIATVAGWNNGQVTNVSTQGAVNVDETGYVASVGGFIGSGGSGSFSSINSDVDVNIRTRTASMSQVIYVGGFAGNISGGTMSLLKNSGSLTVNSAAWIEQTSAFIGNIDNVTLSDSYSIASMDLTAVQGVTQVGLLTGQLNGAFMNRTYVTGAMTLSGGTGITYAGSLIGTSRGTSSITNSFWDTTAIGQTLPLVGDVTTGALDQSGSSGQNYATLTLFSTFTTTNFVSAPWSISDGYEMVAANTWGICNGVSAPFLRSMTLADPCPMLPEISIATSSIVAGGSVSISGNGYQANEQVRIELHSTPVVLTTLQANGAGEINALVTIPAATGAGNHDLVLYGLSSTTITVVPITVTAALAQTGSRSTFELATIYMLFIAGALLLKFRRKIG